MEPPTGPTGFLSLRLCPRLHERSLTKLTSAFLTVLIFLFFSFPSFCFFFFSFCKIIHGNFVQIIELRVRVSSPISNPPVLHLVLPCHPWLRFSLSSEFPNLGAPHLLHPTVQKP